MDLSEAIILFKHFDYNLTILPYITIKKDKIYLSYNLKTSRNYSITLKQWKERAVWLIAHNSNAQNERQKQNQ